MMMMVMKEIIAGHQLYLGVPNNLACEWFFSVNLASFDLDRQIHFLWLFTENMWFVFIYSTGSLPGWSRSPPPRVTPPGRLRSPRGSALSVQRNPLPPPPPLLLLLVLQPSTKLPSRPRSLQSRGFMFASLEAVRTCERSCGRNLASLAGWRGAHRRFTVRNLRPCFLLSRKTVRGLNCEEKQLLSVLYPPKCQNHRSQEEPQVFALSVFNANFSKTANWGDVTTRRFSDEEKFNNKAATVCWR